MTQPNNFASLYRKLMDNECSPEDVDQLLQWLSADKPDPLTEDLIHEQMKAAVPEEAITADLRNRLEIRLKTILETNRQPAVVRRLYPLKRWGWAAAAVVAALVIGTYFWLQNGSTTQAPPQVATTTTDVAPGRNGAVLTLADGSNVLLDSLGNGTIAIENGARISLEDGKITYGKGTNAADIRYNTMSTPNGRQFTVVLPDGTKVWLNAASSLRYPTMFTGTERKVEITGEAYFEVAKNASMPFRALVNNSTVVEVLGTAFNISSYNNEKVIKATLVEGAVRVITDNNVESRINSVVLKPGQQAKITAAETSRGALNVLNNVDIGKVLAWKNGLFNFNGVKLEDAMMQLARWYDIEIVYEKDVPNITFFGEVSRDVSLAGLLKGLEGAGVNFRIEEGKKLVVYP
ncbi:FecR family protein [Pseudoflavitalea rhizosphaerae]|uniref:FecR family protein n=1 Tax=Pseudoflavitalea rhizosphaerae TaxID=1884793 RepID=UPI000F8C9874|nr:FecR family protein [Pseudoflavitalea rhizosphaerae]